MEATPPKLSGLGLAVTAISRLASNLLRYFAEVYFATLVGVIPRAIFDLFFDPADQNEPMLLRLVGSLFSNLGSVITLFPACFFFIAPLMIVVDRHVRLTFSRSVLFAVLLAVPTSMVLDFRPIFIGGLYVDQPITPPLGFFILERIVVPMASVFLCVMVLWLLRFRRRRESS